MKDIDAYYDDMIEDDSVDYRVELRKDKNISVKTITGTTFNNSCKRQIDGVCKNHKQIPMRINDKIVHIDQGIANIVYAMNNIDGITTKYSCEGDDAAGQKPYILFSAKSINAIKTVCNLFRDNAQEVDIVLECLRASQSSFSKELDLAVIFHKKSSLRGSKMP